MDTEHARPWQTASVGTSRDDFDTIVGRNVRDARMRMGMTQTQLADSLGIGRVAVTNLETGKRGLSVWELVKVCRELAIDLADIVAGCSDEPAIRAVTARRILDHYLDYYDATPRILNRDGLEAAPEALPLPWLIPDEYATAYPAQMLHLLARRRGGEDLPEQLGKQLDDWLRRLEAEKLVVAFSPATGFAYVDAALHDGAPGVPVTSLTPRHR